MVRQAYGANRISDTCELACVDDLFGEVFLPWISNDRRRLRLVLCEPEDGNITIEVDRPYYQNLFGCID